MRVFPPVPTPWEHPCTRCSHPPGTGLLRLRPLAACIPPVGGGQGGVFPKPGREDGQRASLIPAAFPSPRGFRSELAPRGGENGAEAGLQGGSGHRCPAGRRVDNARVWGRRERLQRRPSGPSFQPVLAAPPFFQRGEVI